MSPLLIPTPSALCCVATYVSSPTQVMSANSEYQIVGDFAYLKKDLIGHGAFAIVFKGHNRKVSTAAVRQTFTHIASP